MANRNAASAGTEGGGSANGFPSGTTNAGLTRRSQTSNGAEAVAPANAEEPILVVSPAVAMRGRMTSNGWQPENHQWLSSLLDRDEHGKLIGRNPLTIDLRVLRNSGHPPRRTKALIGAWSNRGDEPLFAPIRKVSDVRGHCLVCSSDSNREVRECRVINCPFWAYRLGRNPHNPRRGQRPFFGAKPPVTARLDAQADRPVPEQPPFANLANLTLTRDAAASLAKIGRTRSPHPLLPMELPADTGDPR
jgi:hypothetical protein